jgi:hypothetical protein
MIKNNEGRTIVFDAFIKNDKLYLISTYYAPSDSPITITLNGVPMIEGGHNQYEPVRYFVGSAPAEASTTIHVDGVPHSITPERIEPTSGEFAVATLFKHDYARIPDFVAYYRGQGCQKFYLYYNGPVLPESLPQAPDIVYRCWDVPYWNYVYGTEVWNRRWIHCGQTTFLTTIRYRYMQDYTWFGLIDLDEWAHGPQPVLDMLRSAQTEVVIVKNHWAHRHDDVIDYNPVGMDLYNRSKCFYRNTYTGDCSIHHPKRPVVLSVFDTLKLLHMADNMKDAGDSVPRQTRIDGLGPNPATLLVADLLKT